MVGTRILSVLVLFALLAVPVVSAEEEAKKEEQPRVEVMFVLDTTGSMGGLIQGAKEKIWKIVNQIVSGEPTPDLWVGLIGYRDRRDAYVTEFTPLTDDLDSIYGTLLKFKAGGGGDQPESVNQALAEALTKPQWTRDERTLRIIYLVGDAPPHMDYEDDVKYPVTCEKAARAGIIINTVQCGGHAVTTPIWQDIARKAEGRYVAIQQSGGMQAAVKTPYDEELAKLGKKITAGAVYYGTSGARAAERLRRIEADDEVEESASGAAKAERAGYLGKSGRVAANDLLALLERKEVKLDEVKPADLPEDLAKLTPEERKARIEKLLKERAEVRKQILVLDAKRAAFIKDALAKTGEKRDAFDDQVLEMLRAQAKRVGIDYR